MTTSQSMFRTPEGKAGIIPGAGHAVAQVQPEIVNQLILAFLGNTGGSPAVSKNSKFASHAPDSLANPA